MVSELSENTFKYEKPKEENPKKENPRAIEPLKYFKRYDAT
jgi:hypothetical protein